MRVPFRTQAPLTLPGHFRPRGIVTNRGLAWFGFLLQGTPFRNAVALLTSFQTDKLFG